MVLGTTPKRFTVKEMSNFLRFVFEGNTRNIMNQHGMAINILQYNNDNCAIKGKR